MPGNSYQNSRGYPIMNYRNPHRYGGMDSDPDPNGDQFRKLFIGGLSYETDEKSLREHFSKYGDITDCIVMRDTTSKRSRGFGFITFKNKDSVEEVQKKRPHRLDSRDVETKRAMPRDDPNSSQLSVKKMFVGGLKDDTTEEMIRQAFGEFGKILEVELINDKNSGKIKGFCFVTFDDYDSVDKCVLKKRTQLNSRKVEMKKAFAKGEMENRGMGQARMGMNMGMGMGPMSMGRGGRGDFGNAFGNRDYDRGFGFNNGFGYQGFGHNANFWQGGYNDFNYPHQHHGNSRGKGYSNNFGGGNNYGNQYHRR